MDTSERVSIVALLVSLVALLVALLQALQQYFATAEGYRNCAESIIGPWHRTRRRRLVPSEFRFETVYDAPLIRLLSLSECIKEMTESPHRQRIHLLYPLCDKPNGEGERLILETVHPSQALPASWRSYLPAWSGLRRSSEEDATREGGDRPPQREFEDPASALVSWIGERIHNTTCGILVLTWFARSQAFLRAVHLTYSSYGHVSDGVDNRAAWINMRVWGDHPNSGRPDDWYDLSGRMAAEPSQPVVVRQTMHWDVRGSDTTRPVAQTRLGDIIVFALRMGMQWRKLEVENGIMLAVGNGYGLSSANRSGLILNFTSAGDHKELPRIIPSQYADKLLCGILPGDPDLVKRDFSMVRRDRQPEGEGQVLRRALEFSGVENVFVYDNIEPEAARHDFTKLLCPFLPQEFSTSAIVRFAGWPWHRAPSFLHYFESRIAFLQQLDAELKHDHSHYSQEDLESLQVVKAQLDQLKDDHALDFYCVEFTPDRRIPATRSKQDRGPSVQFLGRCGLVFRRCTEFLKDHEWGWPTTSRLEGSSTRYTLLVAAHTVMTRKAVDEAEKEYQEVKRRLGMDVSGRKVLPSDWAGAVGVEEKAPREARDWFRNPRFYFQMNKIIQKMKSRDHGIREELVKLRVEVTDAEAQLAWWMMMVRGIAWDMSCYREYWPEDELLVPSTFYQDPTPVMLA